MQEEPFCDFCALWRAQEGEGLEVFNIRQHPLGWSVSCESPHACSVVYVWINGFCTTGQRNTERKALSTHFCIHFVHYVCVVLTR